MRPVTKRTSEILKTVFPGLEGPELKRLSQVVVRKQISPGTIVCHEGKIEHEFYVIVEGEMAVTSLYENGEQRLLDVKGPGQFFGEMALLDRKPRTASVTAIVEVELLEINQQAFEATIRRNPSVALAILREVSGALRRTDRAMIQDLQNKNEQLRQAYQDLMNAHAELIEKERLEREIEIAAQVQQDILPSSFPDIPGFAFAARAQTAQHIGGDFYDIRMLDSHRVGLLNADVSGKGLHAALMMATVHTMFLTEAKRSRSPAQVVRGVHELLLEISRADDMFVTAFCADIDTDAALMRYVRAGHDEPLLYRDGQVSLLSGQGRFLGMFDELAVEERHLQLEPGDTLVLYSDGITDAINLSGERFGVERLSQVVASHIDQQAGATPDELVDSLCEAVFRSVARFQGVAPQFDDMTLQVIVYGGKTWGKA